MLLTIYNLPVKTRYNDVKALIYSNCGFKEVILDNLAQCGHSSAKVTVGLAEEEDAAMLMRKINGLFVDGQQLHVELVKKKQDAQSAKNLGGSGSAMNTGLSQQPALQQPYYQQASYQSAWNQQSAAQPAMASAAMSYASLYGGSTNQNAFANYGYPKQTPYQSTSQLMSQSFATYDQGAPLGFNNQGNDLSSRSNQNDWNYAANASAGNQNSQRGSTNSRWDNTEDSNSRSNRDASGRDLGRQHARSRSYGRDEPSCDFERNASRGYGRDAPSRDRGRDRPSRDHGRDAPSYDRGRDANARDRGRDFNSRDSRNASNGDHGRDAPYSRRNEPSRASHKPVPKFSSSQQPKIYGDHVTDPFSQMSKIYQKRDSSKGFQVRNKPDPKPAPGKKWKEPADYMPPPKRQRKGIGFGNQSNEQSTKTPAKVTPDKKQLNPEKLKVRATTWRCQVASAIAKGMLHNVKIDKDIDPNLFLTEVKRALRLRLETLFGDDYEIPMTDMENLYREKFDIESDGDFLSEVTERLKEHGTRVDNRESAASGDNENVEKKQIKKPAPKAPAPKAPAPKAPAPKVPVSKVVPSYPQGDKRANKENKKANQQLFKDENALFSQLEPSMQKAINEEFDEMCNMITEEFSDEPIQQYRGFHERVKTSVIDDLKKTLKINIAKRLLNVGPIMLRIFNSPKTISRGILAPALAEYGVTSLRKSEKKKPVMYFGTCESYEIHDKLCTMEPIVIDGSTVTIKPFQLTEKPAKMTKTQIQKHRERVLQSYMTIGTGEVEEQGDEVENEAQDLEGENLDGIQEEEEAEENNDANAGNADDGELELNKQNDGPESIQAGPVVTKVEKDPVTDTNNIKLKEESNETCDVQTENDTPNIRNTEVLETNKNKDDSGEMVDGLDEKIISKNAIKVEATTNLDSVTSKKPVDDIDIDDVNEDDLEDWC